MLLCLWAAVKMKQDVCEEDLARLPQMTVTVGPSPKPGLLVSVLPALIMRILGRRWCQSANSAGVATDLQSTQAVKAACLPACRLGRVAGSARQFLA